MDARKDVTPKCSGNVSVNLSVRVNVTTTIDQHYAVAGNDEVKWQHYEELKAKYADPCSSPAEYDAACRRAAEEAGV